VILIESSASPSSEGEAAIAVETIGGDLDVDRDAAIGALAAGHAKRVLAPISSRSSQARIASCPLNCRPLSSIQPSAATRTETLRCRQR
jgi:hypothetical protein